MISSRRNGQLFADNLWINCLLSQEDIFVEFQVLMLVYVLA